MPWIRIAAVLALALLLGACAHRPMVAPQTNALLADERFGNPQLPSVEPLFALSPEMRRFMDNELRQAVRKHGAQEGLFHALNEGGHLILDYDASLTRTASEAFAARRGNCLSLVLMTAAMAREMGLSVGYQLVNVPDIWTRSDQFVMLNGHVNLRLGMGIRSWNATELGQLIVDFQPVQDTRLMRVRPLEESTLIAMFFNNRAVEWMEKGDLRQSYAALRAALRADPDYLNALNTLAVLYRRAGELPLAERTLRALMAADPDNRHGAANLVTVLRSLGRDGEARELEARLPPAPFENLERGLLLASEGRWDAALQAFERQLRLAPDFHGAHFLLARAHFELGHLRQARDHLEQAAEQAPSTALRDRYQAKLRALRRAS
ncbi:MAG: tetratricopeptide repeat protein [Burkholderiales bacterium]|uniref:tetratricopeptide repeat protein n=1 Tax=Inhella sp. TaxID=1921806 RepID=UPI001ACE5916|nr:tetratricopeptide repeat protein [Burkholderiales bacterium]